MNALSREPIVFGPISSLDASSSKDGHRAFNEALGRPRNKLLSAGELSGLRGRGGAGFQTEKK
jgi:NADH:ubiquinone oxidoreductase subunit F (NADH-binding)